MPQNFENYISGSIITLYRRRMFAPIVFLLMLVILWVQYPISNMVLPTPITSSEKLSDMYRENDLFVITTITDLTFTGYTQVNAIRNTGYYYYYKKSNGNIGIILLSPFTCEEGLTEIESVTVHAKVCYGGTNYKSLIDNMAIDLGWTERGLYDSTTYYYLSEPDYGFRFGLFVFILSVAFAIYTLIYLIRCILYQMFPYIAPCCLKLSPFGNPKDLLAEADKELATLPQLATEDMFITEHYFIEISKYGIAFVPIDKILWIYKHSTLHKLFWYHFHISYTLNITADNKLYIRCPKNIKSDIDGIMDYLSEANHDILVGFSEENRKKVHEIQGDPFHFEKLMNIFKKNNKKDVEV
ncbi:MAG: hypothetical protein K6E13_09245 [Lachnospiraceae bacterium]|nr:hypothetical protein [Lachnospiraceae bacterium]